MTYRTFKLDQLKTIETGLVVSCRPRDAGGFWARIKNNIGVLVGFYLCPVHVKPGEQVIVRKAPGIDAHLLPVRARGWS